MAARGAIRSSASQSPIPPRGFNAFEAAAALSVGRPVIFVGPRASEPADWILESGGGWAVRGAHAFAFAREHFDRERNTTRIAELLADCAQPQKAPAC